MKKISLRFKVNGKEIQGEFPTNFTLLRTLRDLGFTEVKNGCEKGDCGCCTVLLDGLPVNACLVLAAQAQGRTVTTVRGLGEPNCLHPLQESFIKHSAIQCGFCTPGMLLASKALLDENPNPTEAELKHFMHGNLCRCTGYKKIIESIMAAAKKMRA